MDDEYRSALGKRIRKQRKAIGLTQVQVAAALDLTQVAVSQWENGTTIPQWTRHRALARVLCIDVDILFPPVPDDRAA